MSKFYGENSYFGNIEVLSLEKNGVNYNVKINFISSLTNCSNYWLLLLNKHGKVLKKTKINKL